MVSNKFMTYRKKAVEIFKNNFETLRYKRGIKWKVTTFVYVQ
ncbi:MAG: hypothetical protein JWM28_3873 [Chitinophagaceae bacterium]|nr:hypothetical protein [Chitinophagaceae bacterium]